jgi:hypothetical protein
MTIQWTVYDSNTGEILRTGYASSQAQALLQGNTPGTKVVTVGSDPTTQKVDISNPSSPVTTARAAMNVGGTNTAASKTNMTANGVDSITISPIPAGASYQVEVPTNQGITDIPPGTISDGSLVITTTVAGTYTVTLKYGTNLDFVVSLNAS